MLDKQHHLKLIFAAMRRAAETTDAKLAEGIGMLIDARVQAERAVQTYTVLAAHIGQLVGVPATRHEPVRFTVTSIEGGGSARRTRLVIEASEDQTEDLMLVLRNGGQVAVEVLP